MKIICIGRNYTNHINELKNDIPKEPIFFLKPDTAIQPKGHPFFIPDFSNDIHYEVEILIRIDKAGKHIEKQFSHKYYSKIGLGVDFTARDLQKVCQEKGLPWEKAKGFDGSAQISQFFIDKTKLQIDNIDFRLEKNGKTVQQGNTKDMLFKFDEIISYVSRFFTLKIGDIIFTGTPKGVGLVKAGDILTGYIEDKQMLQIVVK